MSFAFSAAHSSGARSRTRAWVVVGVVLCGCAPGELEPVLHPVRPTESVSAPADVAPSSRFTDVAAAAPEATLLSAGVLLPHTLAPACVARSCAQLKVDCGAVIDDCGLSQDCGECPGSMTCSAGTCRNPNPALRQLAVHADGYTSNACRVMTDRSLWCWGHNAHGQLGDGTRIARSAPVQVGTDLDWEQVAVSSQHTCALKQNGSLWCWGLNTFAALGTGDDSEHLVPARVATPVGMTWLSVGLNGTTTCAIRGDRTLWCWGLLYPVGSHGTYPYSNVPTPMSSRGNWRALSMSRFGLICAIDTAGTMECWTGAPSGWKGGFLSWDVAHETFPDRWLSASTGTDLARIRSDGTLWLGSAIAPTQLGGDNDWVHLAGGGTLGLRADGSIWSWGAAAQTTRVGSWHWLTIDGSWHGFCGVRDDLSTWCWTTPLGSPTRLHP